MWYKTLILVIPVLLILQACARHQKPEAADNFVMDAAGQRVSWHSDVPVTMYIDSDVPTTYYADVQKAMDIWNSALNKTVFNPPLYTNAPDTRKVDGANEIFWVTQNWFGLPSEQAKTTLNYMNNQIEEADIHINAQDYSFSVGDPQPGQIDFVSLILHELGHVLGLVHIYNQPAVMNPTLDFAPAPDAIRRTPYPIDIASLKVEY